MAEVRQLHAVPMGSARGVPGSQLQVAARTGWGGCYAVGSHSMTTFAASVTVRSLETTRSADAITDVTSSSLGWASARVVPAWSTPREASREIRAASSDSTATRLHRVGATSFRIVRAASECRTPSTTTDPPKYPALLKTPVQKASQPAAMRSSPTSWRTARWLPSSPRSVATDRT